MRIRLAVARPKRGGIERSRVRNGAATRRRNEAAPERIQCRNTVKPVSSSRSSMPSFGDRRPAFEM